MAYSESDTRSKLIDPLIKKSDWLEFNIVRELKTKSYQHRNNLCWNRRHTIENRGLFGTSHRCTW